MLGSVLREKVRLDEVSGIDWFTYRWIPDHEGSRTWVLAELRSQPEDLELIPWEAV